MKAKYSTRTYFSIEEGIRKINSHNVKDENKIEILSVVKEHSNTYNRDYYTFVIKVN